MRTEHEIDEYQFSAESSLSSVKDQPRFAEHGVVTDAGLCLSSRRCRYLHAATGAKL